MNTIGSIGARNFLSYDLQDLSGTSAPNAALPNDGTTETDVSHESAVQPDPLNVSGDTGTGGGIGPHVTNGVSVGLGANIGGGAKLGGLGSAFGQFGGGPSTGIRGVGAFGGLGTSLQGGTGIPDVSS
jgi:hypothetical protein